MEVFAPRQGLHGHGRGRQRDLRELLGIPDGYRVLFLQGGASQHFARCR